jgi:ankyrin repeat protein
MCELELPVDLFPVLAMHLEREDVLALSVSCVSAAKGLTDTREPLVDWIVDRCVRLHGDSPLTSAVDLTSDGRRGRDDCVHAALLGVLRVLRAASRPATSVDAVRALCAASARGCERAVDALLEGDGSPLSGLAAPRAGLMAAVHAEVVLRGAVAGPVVTRLEAAYRALLRTRSARIAARLLDWAPEVEPEHVCSSSDRFGRAHSLVHHACEERRAGVVAEILARRGALPGFRAAMLDRRDARRSDTPLHAALRSGAGEEGDGAEAVVRALLGAGAWHSPRDDGGATPLHLAAERGRADCVRLLLEHACGADAMLRGDASGQAPLHLAAARGSACCVRLLLEHACGAGAMLRGAMLRGDASGRTPLHLAAEHGHTGCVRLLLEHACGADAMLRADASGRTPLHLAQSADAAQMLIDAGADPNAGGPLHHATQRRTPDVARVLLAAGADPNLRDAHGMTALHCARSKAAVDMLVEAGAALDARDADGQTPLGAAISMLRLHKSAHTPELTQLFEALVAAGANPFAKGQHSRPVLDDACAPFYNHTYYDSDACIAILDMLARSPHLATARREDTLDTQGRTPLDLVHRTARTNDAVEAALRKEPWARLWADA